MLFAGQYIKMHFVEDFPEYKILTIKFVYLVPTMGSSRICQMSDFLIFC